MLYFKSAPSSLPNDKITQKTQNSLNLRLKMPYSGIFGLEFWETIVEITISNFSNMTKNALFGYFWSRIFKKYCRIWNKHPQIFLIWELPKLPKKCPNLVPQVPYLGSFGLNIWKAIFILQFSTLKFVKLQNFAKKYNCLNLGLKMRYSAIFGLEC